MLEYKNYDDLQTMLKAMGLSNVAVSDFVGFSGKLKNWIEMVFRSGATFGGLVEATIC